MRFSLASQLFVSTFVFALSTSASAWTEHHLITRAALENEASLKNLDVPVTPIENVLGVLNDPGEPVFKSVAELNQKIKIAREYNFPNERPEQFQLPPALGGRDRQVVEHVNGTINAIDLLAKYSDEPDWGMDLELFNDNEYPDLWPKDDSYNFMGGRVGTPSQAFRHMYWPPFDPKHLFNTFKFNGKLTFGSMGEAQKRAGIFLTFARRAKIKGDLYWTLRFIANALHYLEDCSEPFHTTQVPYKKKFGKWPEQHPLINPKAYWATKVVLGKTVHTHAIEIPAQVTHIVSYYHFSFEDYIARLMIDSWQQKTGLVKVDEPTPTAKIGRVFEQYLRSPDPKRAQPKDLLYATLDIEQAVVAMAKLGNNQSDDAGKAAAGFFPEYPNANYFLPLVETDALNDTWWKSTVALGADEKSEARNDYFKVVATMFEPLGRIVRSVVLTEK